MKTRQVAYLVVALMLVVGMLAMASAAMTREELDQIYSQPPVVTVTPPTLWQTILNLFRINDFTIVGQDRLCDSEPKYRSGQTIQYFARGYNLGYWSFNKGTTAGGSSNWEASHWCSSGHGLFDVYCDNSVIPTAGQPGSPRFEQQDSFYFSCGCNQCNVELYCCPQDCGSGDACPSGKTCTTKTAQDGSAPLTGLNGAGISSYKYCKANEGCSGPAVTCSRINSAGTACESATYTCDQTTVYKSSCPIGSYTYTPTQCASELANNPPQGCTPDWQCSDWTACSGDMQTRTCTDSKSCGIESGKPTTTQSCNPVKNEGCPDGTFKCDDGNCKASCNPDCGDGVCSYGERVGSVGGIMNPKMVCIQDCERTLKDKVSILDVTYGNVDGSKIDKFIPGQAVKVNFKVKADTPIFLDPYLVEAGIIPMQTAIKWELDKPSNFFSLFSAVSEDSADACCLGQPNIADNLKEFQTWTATESIKDFSYTIKVPDKDTKDICNADAPEIYWNATDQNYVLYIIVKNGCFKDGFRRYVNNF